jgi:hypothetical protein
MRITRKPDSMRIMVMMTNMKADMEQEQVPVNIWEVHRALDTEILKIMVPAEQDVIMAACTITLITMNQALVTMKAIWAVTGVKAATTEEVMAAGPAAAVLTARVVSVRAVRAIPAGAELRIITRSEIWGQEITRIVIGNGEKGAGIEIINGEGKIDRFRCLKATAMKSLCEIFCRGFFMLLARFWLQRENE